MKRNVKRHVVIQPPDESIRLVPLTKNLNAVVDAEDYERLMRHSWCAWWSGYSFYAQSRINGKIAYMHRVVLDVPVGVMVDHRNHDTLDNRKANIRVATYGENRRNTRIGVRNTTGFKGVYLHKRKIINRWEAYITLDNVHTKLGFFPTAEEAARRYDKAAIEHFGDFAQLNFAAVGQ